MPEKNKKIEKLFKEYQNYAQKNGFRLNPDKKITRNLIKTLIDREEKYKKRYCPCRLITKNKKKNGKIVCPCAYHKKEIKEQGHCHCFLFIK